jgi:hypothetical protein
VLALRRLREAGAVVVLVSGRARAHLAEVARILGADGALAELGALDACYPVGRGETVHQAIADSGLPAALLDREPGLRPHPSPLGARDGSHCFVGIAGPDAHAFVRDRSGGALRLADNGAAGAGRRVYHLLPAAAGKAAAVALDLVRRDLDPGACLAVGNSEEDLALEAVVGRFALVRNGLLGEGGAVAPRPGLWVTLGAYGEGVLEAVDGWLAGGAQPPSAA